MAPTYWMNTNRNVTQVGLGGNLATLFLGTADQGAPLDQFARSGAAINRDWRWNHFSLHFQSCAGA
ncbi:MAG: hypothetical protein R2911_00885 [Caldilineaceae bacterium]